MRSPLLLLLISAGILTIAPLAAAQAPAPDLVLRIELIEGELGAGSPATLAFNLTNVGTATATGVVVDLTVSDDVVILEGHDCVVGPDALTASCTVPDLPPGAIVANSFRVRFLATGHPTVMGEAKLNEADPNPFDNFADPGLTILPAAPTGLMCSAERDGNHLSWDPAPGNEFSVYRGPDLLFRSSDENSFIDSDVEVGETHAYRVTLFDGHLESVSARCTLTAIPFMPAAFGVVALGGLVLAYAAIRRQ